MSSEVVLGIDLGTSSVRAMLVDRDGHILTTSTSEYHVDAPKPGWAEQRPEQWWQATCEAVRAALTHTPAPTVRALSFSGQMHGTVTCDNAGIPLRPAIIWADQRSSSEVAGFLRSYGADRLSERTANPLATGFQLATLLWLRDNEPATWAAIRHVFLPKDWLRYRMTGKIGTEPSDACSTLLFDTAHDVVNAGGIDLNWLPPVYKSTDIAGELLPDASDDLGLPAGIPVVSGGGDTPTTAVGNGVLEPGMLQCTIGSGGQLIAPIDHPTYDPQLRTHTFCHAVSSRWYVMGATLSAGLSLKWLRNNVIGQSNLDYEEILHGAHEISPGSEGLVFLPYLTGERTPHLDSQACGVFFGLSPRHDQRHFVRAVLEGVAFSLSEGLDVMRGLGIHPSTVVAAGGGARSTLWRQIQANVFQLPVTQAPFEEAAAYGAALYAGQAIGWWSDLLNAPRKPTSAQDIIEPNGSHIERYAELRGLYRRLYTDLRDSMQTHSAMIETWNDS
jgi:xylulokinase